MTQPPGQFGPHPADLAFQHLMARQAVAAQRVSGAERSSWNGVYDETGPGHAVGRAWADGHLSYSRAHVLDKLREMMYYYGAQHTPETLFAYREAFRVMLHENSHLLGRAGDNFSLSFAKGALDPHELALEEGVTELWAQRHTADYIRELRLENAAPGITSVQATDAYPQYTPAVQALCTGLGRNMGLPDDEVLRRINNESPRSKWPAVADMVMQSSGLSEQIKDPAARAQARDQIQVAMQSQFSQLPTLYDPAQPLDQHAFRQMQIASYAAGQAAIQQAQQQVNALRLQHATPPAPTVDLKLNRIAQIPPPPSYPPPPSHPPRPSYPPPPGHPPTVHTAAPSTSTPAAASDAQQALAVAQTGVAQAGGERPNGAVHVGQPGPAAHAQQPRTHQPTTREQGD